MNALVLALDQGTSSSRAISFNHSGGICARAQLEFNQHFPHPGWVEHDPLEIWRSQLKVAGDVIQHAQDDNTTIAAIGITNQRETVILWDRQTGKPIYNAIVWQDRRTAGICNELKDRGLEDFIQQKTGLVIDAYFSATKIQWILENVPGARQKALKGELAAGTIDTWLLWQLTGGSVHATDVSNASRSMLFNIHTLSWDDDLLELFEIPMNLLPGVHSSSAIYGYTSRESGLPPGIPIAGVIGDQQAALFGQMCTQPGMVKNTYGTGCFLMLNTGDKPVASKHQLLTTVAWKVGEKTSYALEGSVFIAGALVQWLRDGLGLIRTSDEIEALAKSVTDSGGVYLVPAFTGLGAPHWDSTARGAIIGLTRGTTAGHIARAALESIAFQTLDVIRAMEADAGLPIRELRVDGGATVNALMMQFQADLLNVAVVRPQITETTALGAAYMAGLAVGYWSDSSEIGRQWTSEQIFKPSGNAGKMSSHYQQWSRALQRSRNWIIE